MSLTQRVRKTFREDGFSGLLRGAVRVGIRRLALRFLDLPSARIGVYNGVPVRKVDPFSSEDEFPDHEEQLIQAMRTHLEPRSRVVLIGAGSGASTVVAAHAVGKFGSVTSYEAAKETHQTCEETLRLNKVTEIATSHHGIVEAPIHTAGEIDGAPRISASKLPDCDALVMDCEGAERMILEEVDEPPGLVIVETHAHFDSSSQAVRERMPEGFEEIECLERSPNIDILVFRRP